MDKATHKMKYTAPEAVSLAMDGEEVTQELVDILLQDEQAYRLWHEFHLIRDSIGTADAEVGVNFRSDKAFTGKLAEIASEHRKNGKKEDSLSAGNDWFFKGFALLASVASVAVAFWQFVPSEGGSETVAEQVAPRPEQQDIVPVNNKPKTPEVVVPDSVKKERGSNQETVGKQFQPSYILAP